MAQLVECLPNLAYRCIYLVWWHRPVIPVHGTGRQDQEFEVIPSYTVSLRLILVTTEPVLTTDPSLAP